MLYLPDTIILRYVVDSSSPRSHCPRMAIVFVTQFYYQKRALFFIVSFHFVSFRLMELRSVKTISFYLFVSSLSTHSFSIILALFLFSSLILYDIDSHDRSITQNELSGIYATVRQPDRLSAREFMNLN